MLQSFPNLVKGILAELSASDYPILHTRLFFSCWLAYAMDKSITSMQDLFKRLNNTGVAVDISTFSKASKHRSKDIFIKIYEKLLQQVKGSKALDGFTICPIDSTTITLTSKLLWALGYYQVKLFTCLNSNRGETEGSLISFGDAHDYKRIGEMTEAIPENAVGVMDRGFASLEYLQAMGQQIGDKKKYYVVRINMNYKLEWGDGELIKVGTGKKAGCYRVVNFCDRQNRSEYRLVTNLPKKPKEDDSGFTELEVMDIYRKRWQIELLWKFLKMHLKLAQLITKYPNGIAIQIYVSLIAYLILQLIKIPKMWGEKLLDKLRYLQACMCQEMSYVHWLSRIMAEAKHQATKG